MSSLSTNPLTIYSFNVSVAHILNLVASLLFTLYPVSYTHLVISLYLSYFNYYILVITYFLVVTYYLFIAYYLLVISDYLLVIRFRYEVKRWSGYVMVHSTTLIVYA